MHKGIKVELSSSTNYNNRRRNDDDDQFRKIGEDQATKEIPDS